MTGPGVPGTGPGAPAGGPGLPGSLPGQEPVIELANEFTRVVVEPVRTRNGMRLRISVPSSGAQILLCPLELEALAWQDHELFSTLLATPNGPEGEPAPPEPASRPQAPSPEPASRPGPPSPHPASPRHQGS